MRAVYYIVSAVPYKVVSTEPGAHNESDGKKGRSGNRPNFLGRVTKIRTGAVGRVYTYVYCRG